MKIKVTSCYIPFNWYKNMIGKEFKAIYDPNVGKYIALNNGGGGRYIDRDDCEIIEGEE